MFNQALGGVLAGAGSSGGSALGRFALGLGAALGIRSLSDTSDGLIFYHGTSVASGLGLLNGAPLDAATALQQKIDGDDGFYLATHPSDAEYFAARREPGTVLQYKMTDEALSILQSSGAYMSPIPVGPKSPTFSGSQLVVPPSSFSTFNSLQQSGNITVKPMLFH
jgi:hypothetical protein